MASLRRFSSNLCLLTVVSIPGYSQWQAVGPYGGPAEIVRVDSKQPSTVLAGTRNAILYRSPDRGATWTHLPFPVQLAGVLHAIEMDPLQQGVWYAGVEGEGPWSSGVYRTADSGESWTLLRGLTGQAVWSLAIWQGDSKVIAAGTADGVFLSGDAGETWRRISPDANRELRPVVSLAFDPASSDTIFAGTTHLPWLTTNGGASWESIHAGMLDDSDVFSILVNPRNHQVVYASACSGAYRSASGGKLWARLATPRGAFRTYLVTLDPNKPETVYAATSSGLFKSTDSGITFRKVSNHAVKSIAFDPANAERIYFASTTGGVLLSTDGGDTLREANRGFANHTVTSLFGSQRVLYVSAAYDVEGGGLFRSDDFGSTWRSTTKSAIANGDSIRLAVAAPNDPNTILAAPSRGLLRSSDGGSTWTAALAPPGDAQVEALLALPGSLLAGTRAGLFRSSNLGSSWTAIGPKELSARRVRWLQASGDSGVAVITDAGAFLSRDRGNSWNACGQPLPDMQWYGLAFDTSTDGSALAATSHGLFRSTDGCRSWKSALTGLGPGTVSIVTAHPSHLGEFFAAQQGKILKSTNGGQAWQALDDEGRGGSYPTALLLLTDPQERLFALFPRIGVLFSPSQTLAQTERSDKSLQ